MRPPFAPPVDFSTRFVIATPLYETAPIDVVPEPCELTPTIATSSVPAVFVKLNVRGELIAVPAATPSPTFDAISLSTATATRESPP